MQEVVGGYGTACQFVAAVIADSQYCQFDVGDRPKVPHKKEIVMNKSVLSALAFAFALAVSMPVLSVNDANAAASTASATTAGNLSGSTAVEKVAAKKHKKHKRKHKKTMY